MKKEKIGSIILIILAIASAVALFFMDPISQDELYHHFSDSRVLFGIPNFWNVISNIPFMVVSVLGLCKLQNSWDIRIVYATFFIGIGLISIGLISIGSGYYHLQANSQSLVYDRLPMTIVFMALFSVIIIEFISSKVGKLLFFPLIFLGLLSIGYWVFSASGDLRLYALVQFYPMIGIPIILIFFQSKYTKSNVYWILLLAYIMAKLLEHYDSEIYQSLKFISGHSLKHITAAYGLYILQKSYQNRVLVDSVNKEKSAYINYN